MNVPRVVIAGLRGGSGKTVISTGIAAAWRKKSFRVIPFKKGPDYIDAAWLSEAAGQPCRNLDLFLVKKDVLIRSFRTAANSADVAVIEGNRGLYDGMDSEGAYSTAELAKLLKTPVILAVDCTKSTRTVAALVLGCQKLDPDVPIRGVILNRIAGGRHESVLREAVEKTCGLPVLGALPKIRKRLFPERHLGLVPPPEHDAVSRAIEEIAAIVEENLNLEAVWNLACEAPELEGGGKLSLSKPGSVPARTRIGIFRDAVFQFYYPENLEALEAEGGELIEISPLDEAGLPDVDALYIGGGFPETLAERLSSNESFRNSLYRMIEKGLPVYAECGGAVYLGEKLVVHGKEYPMTGVFPVTFGFAPKPQGHGYTVLETVKENPFFSVGESIRGHEFHYTYVKGAARGDVDFAFRVRRGHGFDGEQDGLHRRNVLACYTHIHALGVESWATSLIREAVRFKDRFSGKSGLAK
jgi:cobyrinic acid a,c-diamide synthase